MVLRIIQKLPFRLKFREPLPQPLSDEGPDQRLVAAVTHAGSYLFQLLDHPPGSGS
jgi:hypothetical protein